MRSNCDSMSTMSMAEEISEVLDIGLSCWEYATENIRPSIASYRPEFTYEPRPVQPVNINVNRLDKFLEAAKEKISLVQDHETRAEFDKLKETVIKTCQQFEGDIKTSLELTKEFSEYHQPIVTVPRTGVVRVELKINSRVASFEISCDVENNTFKGIRSDPSVPDFEQLVSSRDSLNDLIKVMRRHLRKALQAGDD